MMKRTAIFTILCTFWGLRFGLADSWGDNYAESLRDRFVWGHFNGSKTLSAREYVGAGAICGILESRKTVACWMPNDLMNTTVDLSFRLTTSAFADIGVPRPVQYFVSVVTLRDVYVLCDTGDVIIVIDGGGAWELRPRTTQTLPASRKIVYVRWALPIAKLEPYVNYEQELTEMCGISVEGSVFCFAIDAAAARSTNIVVSGIPVSVATMSVDATPSPKEAWGVPFFCKMVVLCVSKYGPADDVVVEWAGPAQNFAAITPSAYPLEEKWPAVDFNRSTELHLRITFQPPESAQYGTSITVLWLACAASADCCRSSNGCIVRTTKDAYLPVLRMGSAHTSAASCLRNGSAVLCSETHLSLYRSPTVTQASLATKSPGAGNVYTTRFANVVVPPESPLAAKNVIWYHGTFNGSMCTISTSDPVITCIRSLSPANIFDVNIAASGNGYIPKLATLMDSLNTQPHKLSGSEQVLCTMNQIDRTPLCAGELGMAIDGYPFVPTTAMVIISSAVSVRTDNYCFATSVTGSVSCTLENCTSMVRCYGPQTAVQMDVPKILRVPQVDCMPSLWSGWQDICATCGNSSNAMYCWGMSRPGTNDETIPMLSSPNATYVAVTTTASFACALFIEKDAGGSYSIACTGSAKRPAESASALLPQASNYASTCFEERFACFAFNATEQSHVFCFGDLKQLGESPAADLSAVWADDYLLVQTNRSLRVLVCAPASLCLVFGSQGSTHTCIGGPLSLPLDQITGILWPTVLSVYNSEQRSCWNSNNATHIHTACYSNSSGLQLWAQDYPVTAANGITVPTILAGVSSTCAFGAEGRIWCDSENGSIAVTNLALSPTRSSAGTTILHVAPWGNDTSCVVGLTTVCSSLAGAIAAIEVPFTTVYIHGATTSLPVVIPSTTYGVSIVGVETENTPLPTVTFTNVNGIGLQIDAPNSVVRRIAFTMEPVPATKCISLLSMSPYFIEVGNVRFSGVKCSHAVISSTGSLLMQVNSVSPRIRLYNISFPPDEVLAPYYFFIQNVTTVSMEDITLARVQNVALLYMRTHGSDARLQMRNIELHEISANRLRDPLNATISTSLISIVGPVSIVITNISIVRMNTSDPVMKLVLRGPGDLAELDVRNVTCSNITTTSAFGGCMYIDAVFTSNVTTQATIQNVLLDGLYATGTGAGLYLTASDATIDGKFLPVVKLKGISIRNVFAQNGGSGIAISPRSSVHHTMLIFEDIFAINASTAASGSVLHLGCHMSTPAMASLDVFISNASFENAFAKQAGGAIATGVTAAQTVFCVRNLKITNSVFKNVSANGAGGAVRATIFQGALEQLTFIDCASQRGGGLAIAQNCYNDGTKLMCGTTRISNSSFKGLSSIAEGGSIAVDQPALGSYLSTRAYVDSCSFVDSISRRNGGAIYAVAYWLSITSTNFTNVTSLDGGGAVAYQAIATNSEYFIAKDCTFQSCSAQLDGGAMLIQGMAGADIERVDFYNCTAGRDGGAIAAVGRVQSWNVGSGGWVQLRRLNFMHTSAIRNGGAFYVFKAGVVYIAIIDTTNTSSGGSGGAGYVATPLLAGESSVAYALTISSVLTNSASAAGSGGAFYLSGFNKMLISGCYGRQLNANGPGGYLALAHVSPSDSWSVSFANMDVAHAQSTQSGGYMHLEASGSARALSFQAWNTSLRNCTSSLDGGGIMLSFGLLSLRPAIALLRNFSCVQCTSARQGGALFMYAGDAVAATATLDNVFISRCSAIDGGGIAMININATCTNSTLSGNLAVGSGGGLYATANSLLTCMSGNVSLNVAAYGGGLFIDKDSTLSIRGSLPASIILPSLSATRAWAQSTAMQLFVIERNIAVRGGGVYTETCGVKVSGGVFLHNLAYREGGAIYSTLLSTKTNFDISASLFVNNSAFGPRGGGGIFLSGFQGSKLISSVANAQQMSTVQVLLTMLAAIAVRSPPYLLSTIPPSSLSKILNTTSSTHVYRCDMQAIQEASQIQEVALFTYGIQMSWYILNRTSTASPSAVVIDGRWGVFNSSTITQGLSFSGWNGAANRRPQQNQLAADAYAYMFVNASMAGIWSFNVSEILTGSGVQIWINGTSLLQPRPPGTLVDGWAMGNTSYTRNVTMREGLSLFRLRYFTRTANAQMNVTVTTARGTIVLSSRVPAEAITFLVLTNALQSSAGCNLSCCVVEAPAFRSKIPVLLGRVSNLTARAFEAQWDGNMSAMQLMFARYTTCSLVGRRDAQDSDEIVQNIMDPAQEDEFLFSASDHFTKSIGISLAVSPCPINCDWNVTKRQMFAEMAGVCSAMLHNSFTQTAPAPIKIDGASAIFVGNGAPCGVGADLALDADPIGGDMGMQSAAMVASYSLQGGSVYARNLRTLDIAFGTFYGVTALSSTSTNAICSDTTPQNIQPGWAGALAVVDSAAIYMHNTVIAFCRAIIGGAIYVDPSPVIAASLVWGSNTFWGNSAEVAPVIFTEDTNITDCAHCVFVDNIGSQCPQPISSFSMALGDVSSTFFDHSDPFEPILSVVAGVLVSSPLLVIPMLDISGSIACRDNSTMCTISAIYEASETSIPLLTSSTYRVRNGKLNVFPFGLASPPGIRGSISIVCLTEQNVRLPTVTMKLKAETALVDWTAETKLMDWFAVSSALNDPTAVITPLKADLRDNLNQKITNLPLACSMVILAAYNAKGQPVQVSAGALTTSRLVDGVVAFLPSFQGPFNVTVDVGASCDWPFGGQLVSVTKLRVNIGTTTVGWVLSELSWCNDTNLMRTNQLCAHQSLQQHMLPSKSTISPYRASPVHLNNGVVQPAELDCANCGWVIMNGDNTMQFISTRPVTTAIPPFFNLSRALPSPASMLGNFNLQPQLRGVLLAWAGSNLYYMTSQSARCTISVDYHLADPTLKLNQDAVVAGTITEVLTRGQVTFPGVALRNVLFDEAIGLNVACSAGVTDPIQSPLMIVRTHVVSLSTSVPDVILSSGPGESAFSAMTPHPVVQISINATSTYLADTLGDGSHPLVGYVLPCEARDLIVSTSTASITRLVGSRTGFVHQSSGAALFPLLGAMAPMGSSVKVLFSCNWLSGATLDVLSPSIQVGGARVVFSTVPPSIIAPSSASSPKSLVPAPVIQVQTCTTHCSDDANWILFDAVALQCSASLPSGSSTILFGDVTVLTIGGVATFSRLAVIGTFNHSVSIQFQCLWLSSEPIPSIIFSSLIPAVRTTLHIPSAEHGFFVLYNTELQPFYVELVYYVGSSRWAADWLQIGAGVDDLQCSVSAAIGTTAVGIVGRSSQRGNGTTGVVQFSQLALLPAISNVEIIVSVRCAVRDVQAGDVLYVRGIVQRLQIALVNPPPRRILPSSPGDLRAFEMSGALKNHTGGILAEDGVACMLDPYAASFQAEVPTAERHVAIVGETRVVTREGIFMFSRIGINAPFGTICHLRITCQRPQGDFVEPLVTNVTVDLVEIQFVKTPSAHQLYNTPVVISAYVTQFSVTHGFSSRRSAIGVSCYVAMQAITSGYLSVSGSARDLESVSDSEGMLYFSMTLKGTRYSSGWIHVVCNIASTETFSSRVEVQLTPVEPYFISHPPQSWIPTSGLAKTPLHPQMSILLRIRDVNTPVDARFATCRVSAGGSAIIADAPVSGYSINLPVEEVANEEKAKALAVSTPVQLENVLIGAPFGQIVPISIICTRAQGDESDALIAQVRMANYTLVYIQLPPNEIANQQLFFVSIAIVDAEDVNATKNGNITDGILAVDSLSVCTIELDTNTSLHTKIFNNVATARHGIVAFSGVSVSGPTGSMIAGTISCKLGLLAVPTTLIWSTIITPCPEGTAPLEAGSPTCIRCPSQTYSDGGYNFTSCRVCPRAGVACAGGTLKLLPGFYRTPEAGSHGEIIDEYTEIIECFNPEACLVDLATAERAQHRTHFCAEGYTGPLCGVCMAGYAKSGNKCLPCLPAAVNVFAVAGLFCGLLAFSAWLALFRKDDVNADRTITIRLRIALTYFQMLGTVCTLFVAKGTETFQKWFAVTSAVGDSALNINPVQCALSLSYYTRFILTLVTPLIMAALALFLNVAKDMTVALRARKQVSQAMGWRHTCDEFARYWKQGTWIASVLFVLNLTYGNITSTALNVFNCISFKVGGVFYHSRDQTVECYDATHTFFTFIGGAAATFVVILFPSFLVWVLYERRRELRTQEVFAKFGFIYAGTDIERNRYWYEALVLVRKAAEVAIPVLIKDWFSQISASILLLLCALMCQVLLRPYAKLAFNILETISLLAIIVTQLGSQLYFRLALLEGSCRVLDKNDIIDAHSALTCKDVAVEVNRADAYVTWFLVILNGGVSLLLLFDAIKWGFAAVWRRCPLSRCRSPQLRMPPSNPQSVLESPTPTRTPISDPWKLSVMASVRSTRLLRNTFTPAPSLRRLTGSSSWKEPHSRVATSSVRQGSNLTLSVASAPMFRLDESSCPDENSHIHNPLFAVQPGEELQTSTDSAPTPFSVAASVPPNSAAAEQSAVCHMLKPAPPPGRHGTKYNPSTDTTYKSKDILSALLMRRRTRQKPSTSGAGASTVYVADDSLLTAKPVPPDRDHV